MNKTIPDTKKPCAVLTTIRGPSASTVELLDRLRPLDIPLIVAGDRKGPAAYDEPGVDFLSLQDQLESPFALARKLPTGHYARKNVAYLWAVRRGASCLYETDDDNAPNAHWSIRDRVVSARNVAASPWVNVYRFFTDDLIWPRGLPLNRIHAAAPTDPDPVEQSVEAPIQQGLADGSPDVDAVWRLVLDRPFFFDRGPGIRLEPGTWSPFNSQSTWWWPEVYPLLYLPSYCSFRMTDIWRGFIAQRCLWELGHGLVFHAPEVIQDRNVHNLMSNFDDEIPGYRRNAEMIRLLETLFLRPGPDGVCDNLIRCYEVLIQNQFFPETELDLVRTWIKDLDSNAS